jgi:hypothetical protein
MQRKTILKIFALGVFALMIPAANASITVDFTNSGNGATGEAIFNFGLNSLTLTLQDTVVNPGDVAFNLSGFMFTLTGATGGTLVSSSGQERTVAANGTFTNGSTVATGWVFSASSGTFTVNDLAGGGAGPAHTLIGAPNGSNVYSNANSSIAGNGPHNPFLDNVITFNFSFSGGVNADTRPTNIQWQFGTTPGFSSSVPEPVSLSLVGGGLLALGLFRKRFKR